MGGELECAGAPRDLGFDQGRACGAALRARFERARWWDRISLRLGRTDARSARVARDVRRHFPHQSEVMEGMARGAGVPPPWLDRELLAHAAAAADGSAAIAASQQLTASGALAAASLVASTVVRRSRPEGGFCSLEVMLPWVCSAQAGINESGLAVIARGGGFETGPHAGPALLLAQDCLQRFDSLEAALDWCVRRPAAGRATLLLADGRGEVAGVEIAGAARRVLRPAGGVLVEADAAGEPLAREVREAAPLDHVGLARTLAPRAGTAAGEFVLLDPAARRLGFVPVSGGSATAEIRWSEL